jgi:hypothetical protein
VGFEPTIAVLERAKTVRALDRSEEEEEEDYGCVTLLIYLVFCP